MERRKKNEPLRCFGRAAQKLGEMSRVRAKGGYFGVYAYNCIRHCTHPWYRKDTPDLQSILQGPEDPTPR